VPHDAHTGAAGFGGSSGLSDTAGLPASLATGAPQFPQKLLPGRNGPPQEWHAGPGSTASEGAGAAVAGAPQLLQKSEFDRSLAPQELQSTDRPPFEYGNGSQCPK
jgi:hypothetical protein